MHDSALIEVIGVDGCLWTVSGPNAGLEGVELALSPQGLIDEAPIKGVWQQSAFQEGATYLGHAIEPIDLILPFNIVSDSDDWENVEQRFYAAWDEIQPSQIVVTTGGERRSLEVVKYESITTLSERDPRLMQWSVMTVTARAPWPFWIGDTVVSEAQTVSSEAELAVTVENPTDRPMWLQWAVSAPGRWTLPDFDWGVGDNPTRKITTPTLLAGQDLTIDTNPMREPYVTADGSNISGRFGGVLFQHSVPPHTPPTEVPVTLSSGSGTSVVQCRMLESFKRPWGGRQ